MKQPASALYEWVDERLGLEEIVALGRGKTVPVHAQSFWYYWGGISLFLFLLQALTGVLLLVYYRPGADSFESVRQISYQIKFGWLIRSAHTWGANLMIFSVFVHMFSTFFMKAYRKPREFGWFSGMVLLVVGLGFGFSGYLLPMDELSYFATKVGLEIPKAIPFIGPGLASLIRGGPDVNEFTVQRFFALHVVVLPALFLPVLAFHLWLVQKHGNAEPVSEQAKLPAAKKTMPFFPNFLWKDLAMWLIALNVLAIFASLYPWDLGQPANILTPAPMGIHPEWYFMSSFETMKIVGRFLPGAFGESAGLLLFTAGLILWTLIPLYDGASKGGRRGRMANYFGLLVVVVLLLTTTVGYLDLK